jgi:hypothetical protein
MVNSLNNEMKTNITVNQEGGGEDEETEPESQGLENYVLD